MSASPLRPLPRPAGLAAALAGVLTSGLFAAPGDLRWSYDAAANLFSTPAFSAAGKLFVGTSKGTGDTGANRVLALTPGSTGATQLWSYSVNDWVDSAPALSPDGATVYVGSWNNSVYALNASNGALRWSYATASYVAASPAVASDGTVYVGSGDGSLYALRPTGSPQLKWSYLADGIIEASPAVGPDGEVVFATLGGTLTSLTPAGVLRWTVTLPVILGRDAGFKASPAIAPDGTIYIGSNNHVFYAFEGLTGELKWSFEALEEIDNTAAVTPDGRTIYFASRAGDFYALDEEGVLRWGKALGDVYYSSTTIDAAGNVYLPAYAGSGSTTLYAFAPDGTSLWSRTLPTVVDSSPVLAADGTLFVGGYNNRLYAIETGQAPANEGWPRFRRSLDQSARCLPGVAPAVTASPNGGVLLAGQPFELTAAASGTGPLTYIWKHNGVTLGDTLGPVLTRATSTTDDAGLYEVVVVNSFGGATSAAAALTVGGAPTADAGGLVWTLRRPALETVSVVERSEDLLAWTTTGVTSVVVQESEGVQTIEARATPPAAGRVFLRLREP